MTFNNFSYVNDNDGYPEFEQAIKTRFNTVVGNGAPLFTTDVEDLFDIFLNHLPPEARQHYNCNACRHFVNRFGSLVTILGDGGMGTVMWNSSNVPKFFKASVDAMKEAVLKSRVTGVFLPDNTILGQPHTNGWSHMSVTVPRGMVVTSLTKTAGQLMAEKREERRFLTNALLEYPIDVAEKVLTLVKSDTLYRGDRVSGIAQWFRDLHNKWSGSRNRDNIVWLAVATAPNGFTHVKGSMIGTLLQDIKDGLPTNTIKARFEEKMNPSNFMRSQTAPTEGGRLQAERLVQQMGIENSLLRRYATFEEIPSLLWKGREIPKKPAKQSGVFGHVPTKGKTETSGGIMDLPTTVMTWDKLSRTILPTADSIEVRVDNPNRFMALVTAVDPIAPNILQWDNTFSWYYHGGVDGEIKRRVEEAGGRYEDNEIRCSLIWEGPTDLDLHCVNPRGEHIYYSHGSRKDRFGGYLDLDMNGLDRHSDTPVENMRWASNAPEGKYRFYVHNYAERTLKVGTPFKVELEINGKVYHYQGKPLHNGSKITVFEFDYRKGQEPTIAGNTTTVGGDWNVPANGFVKVKGITESPNLWGDKAFHLGHHVFFVLEGCRDLSEGRGRGFFNEMLKPELREIRKTLEAYTANTPIDGINDASACGVGYSKDSEWNLIVKVTSGNSTRLIKIDRWD